MRQETKYNKIVNFDEVTKEIIMLDETFEYSDGFYGAVGTEFEPISKEQFYKTIDPYLGDDKELLIYMAENFGDLNRKMIEGVDSSEEALKELFFDLSYSEKWDYLREELNLTEEEAYIFNCVGGGRYFDENYQGNVNPELSAVIREYESRAKKLKTER